MCWGLLVFCLLVCLSVLVHLFCKKVYFYATLDPEFDLMNSEALEKPKVRSVINIKM